MESINFSTGYKTYAINGDESNVIRVNLADQNLMHRLKEALSVLNDFKSGVSPNSTPDEYAERLYEFDALAKRKLDDAFGAGTSKALFDELNILTPVNDEGECVFETFINAFMPILKRDISAGMESQREHMRKLDAIADDIKGAAP